MKVIANIWDSFTTEPARVELEVPMFTYADCRIALQNKVGDAASWHHLGSRMSSDGKSLRVALSREVVQGRTDYSIEEFIRE